MPLLKGNFINLSAITFAEQAADVPTPPDGKWRPFFKSGGLYLIDDQGTVTGPVVTAAPVAQVYPTSALLWRECDKQIAGIRAFDKDTSQRYSAYAVSTSNGDEWSQEFLLASGTYTLYSLGVSGDQNGIVTWYLDNVSVAVFDWYYASAALYNVEKSTAGIVVASSGLHTLRGKVTGKNASSGDYQTLITLSRLEKE